MKTIQQHYFKFLEVYVMAGHTYTDEAKKEIDEITKEFVLNNEDDYYYFTRQDIKWYIEILKSTMSNENKSFFEASMYFNEKRFEELLAKFIKHELYK